MIFVYILFGVYLAAVNLYAFLLVRNQKRRAAERGNEDKSGNDAPAHRWFSRRAIAAYAAMFIYRHKTDTA